MLARKSRRNSCMSSKIGGGSLEQVWIVPHEANCPVAGRAQDTPNAAGLVIVIDV